MLKPAHAALAAILLALSGCQPPHTDEAGDESGATAQLPDRDPGAHTVLTAPLTETGNMEAIVQDAVFAPDAQLPAHYHPGEEVLYMIEGTVVLEPEGAPALTMNAGDAHAIPARQVHKAKAGPQGARAVIFRAHPEGEEVRYLVEATEGETQ